MVRQLRAAILALALVVPAGHVVMAQAGTELMMAQSRDSQPSAGVEEPCLERLVLPQDQTDLDTSARDIAWILAGGRSIDPIQDGGVGHRRKVVPPRVLKWPEGTDIRVACAYRHGGLRRWRVGQAPTVAHVRALVSRMKRATGLALNMVHGEHLRPDHTINISVTDDFIPEDFDPRGRDTERHRKYQTIDAGKRIGETSCWIGIFYDDADRLKYAHLTISFKRYADAEVSRSA